MQKKLFIKTFLFSTLFALLVSAEIDKKSIGEILFYPDKAQIKKESYQALSKIVENILNNKDAEIAVEGHTNSTGFIENEELLSKERADAVSEYLISKGIDRSKIKTVGYGGANLKVPGINEENRRAEIIIAFERPSPVKEHPKEEIKVEIKKEESKPVVEEKKEPVKEEVKSVEKPVIVEEKKEESKLKKGFRILSLDIVNKNNEGLTAKVEIKKRENERILFEKTETIAKKAEVEIPEADKIELVITSAGYLPKKAVIELSSKEENRTK
jgi:OmpA family